MRKKSCKTWQNQPNSWNFFQTYSASSLCKIWISKRQIKAAAGWKFTKNQEKKWMREQTWRLCMRPSRDLIFRCGQREIPNSLHFLFRTVRPTFKFFEASIIGRSKYFERSSSVSLDISLVVARFCFLSAKPTIFHHSVWLINFKQ